MTAAPTGKPGRAGSILLGVVTSVLALAVLSMLVLHGREAQDDPTAIIEMASAHISAVAPDGVDDRGDELALWALNTLHEAMTAQTADQRLAKLSRIAEPQSREKIVSSQIATHGLEASDEGFHEVELLSRQSKREGDTLDVSAEWRPVGLMAGEGHRHRLGHSFVGHFKVTWTGAEWRITDFQVMSVDRSQTGTIVDAAPN